MKPLIAVLLATYNGSKYIEEQLFSILNQKNTRLTIYISDDCSSDNTLEIIKKIQLQHKNIVILPKIKAGGAAKNFYRLIKDVYIENFQYIALSDQDDIWNEDKLSNAVLQLRDYKCNGYSSNVTAFWESGKRKLIQKADPQTLYDFIYESPGPGCTFVTKKESFQSFKKFLESNWQQISEIEYHDWLIYAYYRSRNLNWHIDSNSSMMYRQHENNKIGSNSGFTAIKKRISLISSGWYQNEIRKIVIILGLNDNIGTRLFTIKNLKHTRRKRIDRIILGIMALFNKF